MHAFSLLSQRARAGTTLFACAAAMATAPGQAADLLVRVSGLTEPLGQVGCSLFAKPAGFPMDNSGARTIWLPAEAKGVTCRFNDLREGRYAVSVAHDLNGNKKVDTNFLGIPSEPWGVSNNVRPNLRAPHFDEAEFKLMPDSRELSLEIKVAK